MHLAIGVLILGHYSVFKQQSFVCHIQIKLQIIFDLKKLSRRNSGRRNWSRRNGGRQNRSRPTRKIPLPASGLLCNICESWFTIEQKSLHVEHNPPQGRNGSALGRGRCMSGRWSSWIPSVSYTRLLSLRTMWVFTARFKATVKHKDVAW